MKKTITFLPLLLCFALGLCLPSVYADTISDFIYSVNNVTPDSDGNVVVSSVNGHSINSDVSDTADFVQYEYNKKDIADINAKLSGVTATTSDIENGKTAIVSGGSKDTGTQVLWTFCYSDGTVFNMSSNVSGDISGQIQSIDASARKVYLRFAKNTYSKICSENGTFIMVTDGTVRYGSIEKNAWAYKSFSAGATVSCSNSAYGDPASGYSKSCYVSYSG